MRKRWQGLDILGSVNNHLIDYPTPLSISYNWSYGSLSGICLVIQIVTGVFLGMHYCANVEIAFNSVERIMRDVNGGWLMRYFHSNGASMFFIFVYIHIGRGLYYSSYVRPRVGLWLSGVLIYFLMVLTAFIGYVLPFGQMSLWGATVITNLVTALPLVGKSIVYTIWGGYSVSNATLNRFYSLHYLLPFIIASIAILHLVLLHNEGSSNRLGICSKVSKISFYPYCYIKDLFSLIVMLVFFSFIVFFKSNILGHCDNYVMANSLVTPAHIVPEWYFLHCYAILRAVPHKLGGVLLMCMSILVLCVLPFISKGELRSSALRPLNKVVVICFMVVTILLGWIGQKVVEFPYVEIGQILSLSYFMLLLVVLPGVSVLESRIMRNRE